MTGEDDNAQYEVCDFCHRRKVYRKVDGRIDNQAYLRDHVRDFCQPYGATAQVYGEIYGAMHIAKREAALKDRENRQKRIADLDGEKDEFLDSYRKGRVVFGHGGIPTTGA